MSVTGISTTGLLNDSMESIQSKMQQMQKEFQQLGQDLQSGNLSAAQSDFATLQSLSPQSSTTASSATSESSNPIAQEFAQLSQDLQSGNLSAAQQDFSTIQQDMQSANVSGGHHHHHRGGSSSQQSAISQTFSQLGQALQSGDLSSAQSLYSTLQQDFQQTASSTVSADTQPNAVSINV